MNDERFWKTDVPTSDEEAFSLLRFGVVFVSGLSSEIDRTRTERRMLNCCEYLAKRLRGEPEPNNEPLEMGREWFVIEDSRKDGVFAPESAQKPKGFVLREEAEKMLDRGLSGVIWFTQEESDMLRECPSWRIDPP